MLKFSSVYWYQSLYALTLVSSTIAADEILSIQTNEPSSIQTDENSSLQTNEPPSLQVDKSVSQQTVESCKGPHHQWASIRYTTPEGIGYKDGYTTLQGFFSPKTPLKDSLVPFLDLRGHVFDNGKLAANAGLGLRYIGHSRVFGGNAYYDYRNTERQHYNQVAAGLESLGRIWDFRINGYLPVGRKQSQFSHPKFIAFEEHSMLIKRHRNFAMKGANVEVGAHVDHFEHAPFYFAAGPYYLTGAGETAWGGEARAAVDLCRRYLRIEGNVSYDHFFKWIGQAQVSINIPFGRRWMVKRKTDQSCSKTATLYARAIQRIDRNEIIPVGKQKSISRAINPETKEPWIFWFVDNTSSSAGTFEDPFPMLLAAQNASSPNQGIYVFPGDGTTQGMDNGMILQNGQILLGAGVPQSVATTKGTVIVPPLASSSPNLTNTNFFSGNIVTLANNNMVSGFNVLAQNGHGLTGTGISNLFANQNTFINTTNNSDFDGINLINPSGQIFVSNSTFNGFFSGIGNNGNGIYLELDPDSFLSSINITGSHFSNMRSPNFTEGGNGILFNVDGGILGAGIVSNCSFSNSTNFGAGITVSIGASSVGNTVVSNVNISDCSFRDIDEAWAIYTQSASGIADNITISNCAFANSRGAVSTIESEIFGGIIDHFDVSNNTFENIETTSSGVYFTQLWEGTINQLNVAGNSFNTPNSNIFLLFTQPIFSKQIALHVLGNTFVGASSSPTGYASSIDLSTGPSGSLCLEFIGNSALPISNPTPYLFIVSPPIAFNRTIGSDNTTNIGEFQIGPGVGAPGTCSE